MTEIGVVYMERKNERYCIVVVSSPFPLLPHTTDLCIRGIHHLFLFEVTLVPHQYDLHMCHAVQPPLSSLLHHEMIPEGKQCAVIALH